jgi:hypothetical protein
MVVIIMRLINQLSTQTSSAYKNFISLFKYNLLLILLLLLAGAVDATPIFIDANKSAAATKTDKEITDITATDITNKIDGLSILKDGMVSRLSFAKEITTKSIVYIGVTQVRGKLYTFKGYSDLFYIDVSKKSAAGPVDLLIGKCVASAKLPEPGKLILDSIRVYPKLDRGLQLDNNTGATAGAQATILKLTNGLYIHKGAELLGTGLVIDTDVATKALTLKADINNDGIIKVASGRTAVTIGNAEAKFPLESADDSTTAKFINSGVIEGETAIKLLATNRGLIRTNNFELTNKESGVITGKITNSVTAATAVDIATRFNLINNGHINITAAANSIGVNKYSGSGRITVSGITNAIATPTFAPIQATSADFSGGTIVLKASKVFTNQNLYIVKATNITGFTKDQLLYRFDNKSKILIGGSVTITSTAILVTNATATVLTNPLTIELIPKRPIRLTNIASILATTKNKIEVFVEASATEFAGIIFKDARAIIENSDAITTELTTALDVTDVKDYPDILMPDSSSSVLNVSSKITSKVFDHIANRIISKNINFLERYVTAVNSGDITDNLGMWSRVAYIGSNQKKTKSNQDYSNLSGFLCNIGLDTNLNHNMVIGACYGFSYNVATIHGAYYKTKKAKNKMMNHSFSVYGSFNCDNAIDANFATIFGFNKNDYKEVGDANNEKYNSIIFGLNTSVVYPINTRQCVIDILGRLGFVHVSSKEHGTKYNKETSKQNNMLINFSFGSDFRYATIVGYNMQLFYTLGLMVKLVITTGDEYSVIVFDKAKNTELKVQNRKVDMFSINCNIDLNLQVQKNLDVTFDFDFGMNFAPVTISYGVGAGVIYKF